MSAWDSLSTAALRSPRASIVALFVTWKGVLFLVALASPGLGYDTSTILAGNGGQGLATKLTRWDAIYFLDIARRGYLFEQEWAFGWGHTGLLSLFQHREAAAGILISTFCHLCSSLVLYELTLVVFRPAQGAARLALISATLHVLSPAGLFLFAPYPESAFSLLQFVGYYFYVRSYLIRIGRAWSRDLFLLGSGLSFAIAATFRGNGIVSGLVFFLDAILIGWELLKRPTDLTIIRRLITTVAAGTLLAVGVAFPQALAYIQYCTGGRDLGSFPRTPWCSHYVPSIYSYVQSHYWNVGLFRYWTLGNIPLFLLALPIAYMMVQSLVWTYFGSSVSAQKENSAKSPSNLSSITLLQSLALPQLAILVLALFVFHVQIITRISSGYPVWYWWLATSFSKSKTNSAASSRSLLYVRWCVLYSIIQGGLFASFLPPA